MTELPGSGSAEDIASVLGRLAALRGDAKAGRDPVRFAYLESLARRLPAWQGAARQRIEARLAAGLDLYTQRLAAEEHRRQGDTVAVAPASPLGQLLQRLATASDDEASGGLKAVRQFQGTWAALSVARDVAHAQARVPENAGPLNSHALAVRACLQLQSDAPAYLSHWLRYFDALSWLEQTVAQPPAAGGVGRSRSRAGGGKSTIRPEGSRRKAGKV